MTDYTPEIHTEDVVVVDFCPERRRDPSPEFDAPSGAQIHIKPASGPTAAEAVAAAKGWTERRKEEWDAIIAGEAIQRDMTEAEERLRRLGSISNRLNEAWAQLYQLSKSIRSLDEQDTEALLTDLNGLHRTAGAILEDIERLSGREYEAPGVDYKTLRLVTLGGYRVDPKTGQKMCPFSHYRQPVSDNSNSRTR